MVNLFCRLGIATDIKLYSNGFVRLKLYLYLSTMPNPKGNPQNFEPAQPKGDKPLTDQLSFRVSKEMKEEVKAKDDPPEFCRQAIQKALDEDKKK
ncbi:MAG: hypothetical protein RMZ42_01535 [Nostoc sp. DedQUE05]|uniref:hypothetical protein n=2 Tax=Nostoc TaxID=1177 RepID=UPI002AD2B4AD|nr:hypothetical protein [Nostoc sp. DedQUE05]MDZ8090614.1 hypothetical protein [Nostoc sp. DedQUE05]